MKRPLLITMLSAIALFTKAQLIVEEELNDSIFICSIAGPGIAVTNLHRTCYEHGSGYFNSDAANVGIDNGILLTSGSINIAPGPNTSSGSSGINDLPGDTDLYIVTGVATFDACIVEYDMIVMSDTVRMNYVFGSEEYPEYVGSPWNDAFAFWVSGPGITDTVNIATIPGTDTAIAINYVNAYTNSEYYIANGEGGVAPYDTDDYYIQYDGLTVLLEGKIATIPGETYHMKIAIADAGDEVFDSGVFLKTGSLGSLRMTMNTATEDGSSAAKEGCSAGYINIINETPGISDLVLDYYITGTATNGVDYMAISDQLIIPAGDTAGNIEIDPAGDMETEGTETVKLVFYNPQSGFIYDSIEIAIEDGSTYATDFNYTTEYATAAFHDASPASIGWSWTFGDGATSEEKDPVHTYSVGGTYDVCLNASYGYACDLFSCKTITVEAQPLAIQDYSEGAIAVYPNPAHDIIKLACIEELTEAHICIANSIGEILYSGNYSNNKDISCAEWGRGIYFITLTSAGESYVKRIVLL